MTIEQLREMIKTKKEEARGLLSTDLEKAETLTKEVRDLQKKLDLSLELEEEEKRDLITQKNTKEKNDKEIGKVNEMRSVAQYLLGNEMTTEERAVVKIADNSAIIPKQFINELEELRDGFGSLKSICHVIPVTSYAGTKPCIDITQGNTLPIVLEGADIEDDSIATTEIDFKVDKIGKLIRLSSESVDDAVVDIENLAKTVFLEKATRTENARILDVINKGATPVVVTALNAHTVLAKTMDEQVPAVKSGLITLVNATLYAELKNKEDKEGRNLNLITVVGDTEYFNGKPIIVFDDSLVKLTELKKNLGYMLNSKEAVKFFDREEITIARGEDFDNDTKKVRILERIDVVKGSARSIKKIEF